MRILIIPLIVFTFTCQWWSSTTLGSRTFGISKMILLNKNMLFHPCLHIRKALFQIRNGFKAVPEF